ncbi:cation-efflux pump [Aestuariivirga litoralis]|uniref:cation-efflux pump n=1 Tax=Aestuariivirga litoralis TaxID=2650924 RepID=UPI0018C76D19|nr:cation-efflux pump [Aestuariivirga litoralis]MBG1231610.1 cation-efflux pump [Aestuariivirga litoralis]
MSETSSGKHQAALLSMVVSAALAGSKLVVALLTGSLGVLSEALHSLIDFGATVMTLLAVRWADEPADDDHHYGHAKIESVAALMESVLLVLTALYIAYEAVLRLMSGAAPHDLPWWAPALFVIAILVDLNRSRALMKVAKAESSEALAADAAHFRSDMYGSTAVLAGLMGIWLGLPWADSAAALVVSGFIAWIAVKLGRDTLATLLDRAPDGVAEKIRAVAEHEAGVLRVNELRLRQAGATTYVSLAAEVPRTLPPASIEGLREELKRKIEAAVGKPDLSVVLNPVALDSETAQQKVSVIAAERGLYIHHLVVQNISGKLAVSFDVEMDGATPLDEAHERATELEDAIRDGLGGDVEVESHVEPKPESQLHGEDAGPAVTAKVEKAIKTIAAAENEMSDVHNVRVRRVDQGLFVHYHCRFAPGMRIVVIHQVQDRVEARLMDKLKNVRRVVAHAEPVGRARHKL